MENYQTNRAPRRVLVCGSNYGAVYLHAVAASSNFRLAGIFARGSERSQGLARQFAVPLFTDVDSLSDIDIACVALPATNAHHVTLQMLRQGVSVVREQPLGPNDLARCLRSADAHHSLLHVNHHWAYLPEVIRFIGLCRQNAQGGRLESLTVTFNRRMIGFVPDLLFRAAGSYEFGQVQLDSRLTARTRMVALELDVGGLPCTLLTPTSVGAFDDGRESLTLRLGATCKDRELTLVDVFGPVIVTRSTGYAQAYDAPLWECCSTAAPSSARAAGERLAADVFALDTLARTLDGGECPQDQGPDRLQAAAHLTMELQEALGMPTVVGR